MQSRKSLIIFLSEYIKSAIGFVTLFFVARLMGAEAIGVIGYHLGLLGLFAICLDLGISTAHIKRVSEKKDLGECVGTFLTLKLAALVIYSLVILIYIYFRKSTLEISAGMGYVKDIFVILFVYYVFDQLTSVLLTTFSGRQEFVKLNIPTLIGRLVKMVVAISFALLGWKAKGLAYAYLLEAVISLSYAAFLFWKSNIQIKKPTSEMLKSYVRYALPLMVIIPTSVFSANIVQVMIGKLSNAEQVGFYFVIQSLISIPNAISSSAMVALLPKVSSDYAKKNYQTMTASVEKAARYLSIIVTLVAAIFCGLSDLILRVCYNFYSREASLCLVFLSLSTVVASIARPYLNFLVGIEKHYKNVLVNLGALFVVCLCCAYFIPSRIFMFTGLNLGAAGAGLAQLVMWVFAGIWFYYLARKEFHFPFNYRIFKHWLSGFVAFLFIWIGKNLFPSGGIFLAISGIFILSAVCLSVYFLCLILLKEWQRADWQYVLRLINPASLTKDVALELK